MNERVDQAGLDSARNAIVLGAMALVLAGAGGGLLYHDLLPPRSGNWFLHGGMALFGLLGPGLFALGAWRRSRALMAVDPLEAPRLLFAADLVPGGVILCVLESDHRRIRVASVARLDHAAADEIDLTGPFPATWEARVLHRMVRGYVDIIVRPNPTSEWTVVEDLDLRETRGIPE